MTFFPKVRGIPGKISRLFNERYEPGFWKDVEAILLLISLVMAIIIGVLYLNVWLFLMSARGLVLILAVVSESVLLFLFSTFLIRRFWHWEGGESA